MSLQGEVRSTSVQESGNALRSILISFAITLVSLFGFATWSVGQAVTVITVTVGNDFTTAGQTTLRDAINIANDPGTTCPCLIDFNPAVTNVTPSSALPAVTKNDVTIDGGGTVALTSSSGQSFPGLTLDGLNGAITSIGIGGFSTGVLITNNSNQVLTSTIGSPLLANQTGVVIDDGIDNRIIGNSIVGNSGFAISLTSAAVANEILNNEIASNVGGGIDLGVSFNDSGDFDTGFGNQGQNFPVVSSARLVGGNLEVNVYVDSSGVPGTLGLLVELFESDGSSFPTPQGKTPLGTQCFPGNLIAYENMTVPAGSLSLGSQIIGTATSYADSACTPGNASDGTSQFSSFSSSAAGAFVVNTTADYPLPDSDPGVTSLREAITEANLVCGSIDCAVRFNIPTGDPGYNATEGTFNIVLSSALGPLPPIRVSYFTIDGFSQQLFTGSDTNPDGPEIVINGSQLIAPAHGLVVDGSWSGVNSSVINDLVIQGFPGDGIHVVGDDLSANALRIMSQSLDPHTVSLSTINTLIFRNYLGTNATGTAAVPNAGDGVHLTSFVTSTRIISNVISGNTGYGVYAGLSSEYNRIDSNKIGTDASGSLPLGNGKGGVYLDSPFNSVGYNLLIDAVDMRTDDPPTRSRPIRRDEVQQPSVGILTHAPLAGGNVIAFNNGPGVLLDNGASNNDIYGNLIRENTGEGVLVTSTASSGNTITQNDIFLNGALGIDLGGTVAGGDGVTPNDGTSGAGPNELADHPIITSAVYDVSTNTTTIEGTYFDSNAYSQSVRIEVFSNNAPDPSGFGEGESYLGFVNVFMTGFTDPWTFNHTGDLSGMFATANATLPSGSTSEFSEAVLVQSLDVGIVKTGPATVIAGQPMTYTLTVTNYGPATGGEVTVTDPLPTGVGFTSVTYSSTTSSTWSCGETGGTVTCSALDMDDLEVLTVTINGVAPTTGGMITNTATVDVDAPGIDSDPNNNSSSVQTMVQTANLTVSKTASPEPVDANAPLTYTITVGNSGAAPAAGVSLIDNLPAGVTYQGFTGAGWTCTGTTTISCTFGSALAAGASTVLTLSVLAPSTGGSITNNVAVSTTTPESSTADNSATATTTVNPPQADLSIFKDGPSSVAPGDPVSWTVTVTNLGPGTALSVSVVDTLPSTVLFNSAAAPAGWSCIHNSGVVTCSTASMAPSTSATIGINATAPSSEGTITNSASVSSTTGDPATGNNSSSKSTTVGFLCPQGVPLPVAPAFGAIEPDTEVTFSWQAIADALGYQIVLLPENGPAEVIGSVNGSAPEGLTMSLVATARPGLNVWAVRALFANNCSPAESLRFTFTVQSCPTGVPVLTSPLGGIVSDSPVIFRWTGVPGAIRYDLHASINSSPFTVVDSVDSDGSSGEFTSTLALNPGTTVTWFVEAHFAGNCPPTRSEVIGFESGCFPPIPSVVGEVTSGKPYEVRATIGTAADEYEFQEALDPFFENIIDTKLATSVPGAEYVAAIFEHEVEIATRYHYRARIINENNCPFSPIASTAVIPIPDPSSFDTDIVVQFGIEEPVTQQLLIPSPDPESGLSFTFIAETDRDWLTVSPAAGTMGPGGVLFTVVSDPEGLPVGTNTGTVIVTFTALASGKIAPNAVGTTTSVPVSVSLVTPVTNRGKDSPVAQSLIIPAVAHVDGVGAEWRTDARLVNLGLSTERYFLNFTSSQQDGTVTGKSAEIRLAPGQTTALDDMVKHWYGLGSIAGEGATGVLEIRPLSFTAKTGNALVTRTLVSVASSRTYAKSGLATMGQYIPALPFSVFVGSQQPEQPKTVLSLQQLAQTSAYRTNLGLVEASGKSAAVEIRFFDAAGDSLLTVPVSLQAGEHRQFNQILAQNGLTNLPIGRAEVEVMSGEGRITAYASVVDNATSDPMLVEAVNLANLGASKYVVPGIAHLETGAARWRSDMQIFNAGAASVQATLHFFRTGESTAVATQQVQIQPGTITSLENIVALFGESNVGGAVQITTDSTSQLVVTARTFDQQENGTVGQFIPAVTVNDAIGIGERAIQVLQMEESPNIRSNLGVVEVTGEAVTLEISAFVAESRTTPRVQVQLKANEFRQFNQILRSLNVGNTYNARIAVRVVGGQGRIAAYGSAVDNRTQDPTYVPGQ